MVVSESFSPLRRLLPRTLALTDRVSRLREIADRAKQTLTQKGITHTKLPTAKKIKHKPSRNKENDFRTLVRNRKTFFPFQDKRSLPAHFKNVNWNHTQPKNLLQMLPNIEKNGQDPSTRSAYIQCACAMWCGRHPELARKLINDGVKVGWILTDREYEMLQRSAAAASYFQDADLYYRMRVQTCVVK